MTKPTDRIRYYVPERRSKRKYLTIIDKPFVLNATIEHLPYCSSIYTSLLKYGRNCEIKFCFKRMVEGRMHFKVLKIPYKFYTMFPYPGESKNRVDVPIEFLKKEFPTIRYWEIM